MSLAERGRRARFLVLAGDDRAGETPALPLLLLNDAHEMRDFGDHPARGRRVRELADATDAIESETDKGLALVVAAPDRAADLLDLDGLPGGRIRCRH